MEMALIRENIMLSQMFISQQGKILPLIVFIPIPSQRKLILETGMCRLLTRSFLGSICTDSQLEVLKIIITILLTATPEIQTHNIYILEHCYFYRSIDPIS